ncbi:Nif3-like dinuclear metal center hexameric protein [Phascolarctobacterium sp.]|uniref:Nif3-like dinuclear metal center hexameric protein n=1 Tax=Phascolarctobacterium sp. TaxID=2049039 RepID=UPI003077A95D
MEATVNDIAKIMDGIAPPNLAESWDNVGLLVGRGTTAVKKMMIALDVSPEVVAQALEQNVQMIVTHHPVIFTPVKKMTDSIWQHKLLLDCAENKIAVYSAHTSLDSALGGVNDVLAEKLGLRQTEVLLPSAGGEAGLGRIGILPVALTLAKFAEKIKAVLKLERVAVGDAGSIVEKVALCGGAGADFIDEALAAGADTFVTGDVKYHAAQQAVFSGMNIIDATHQGTELPVINMLADRIALRLSAGGFRTQVLVAKERKILQYL